METIANIIDIHNKKIFHGRIKIENGKISSIQDLGSINDEYPYIAPGLIDSHVHIESSMLTPSRFSELCVSRGTIGVVCDPHEIANVMGRKGVEYMMENAKQSPLKFFFGVPSCVPATAFETSGGEISSADIEYLFQNGAVALAEMMNYPGVIYDDKHVWEKINIAKKYNKPIDGHAPGLVGEMLQKYIKAGITTDHECSTLNEAYQRMEAGMFVQIREGSAARNFENLFPLLNSHPNQVMLCTDDSHPDDLIEKGHIDKIVRMALQKGVSLFDIYQAALINPVFHYHLPVGMLRQNDDADFIVIDHPDSFNVLETYINGVAVFEQGKLNYDSPTPTLINNFINHYLQLDNLKLQTTTESPTVRVIEVKDGELLTKEYLWKPTPRNGEILASSDEDIAKIVVVNRYHKAPPSIGFVHGLGLKNGSFGATIAHDSHNIIVVGVDDESIFAVIEELFRMKGGVSCIYQNELHSLPLPIAGLMSDKDGSEVAKQYAAITSVVKNKCMTNIQAPFMTLSFLSLLVIPSLKIGDRGLFDVDKFQFVNLIQ